MKLRMDALPAFILLFVSCRRPDYFPLADGQTWRYATTVYEVAETDTVGTEGLTYEIAVTGSGMEAGLGKVYEVRITRDDEPFLSFFFRKTRDAVFVLPASHLDGLEPTAGWEKLLELPLRKDAFWYGDAGHSVSFEVLAQEAVSVPAGTFHCFRVRLHAAEPWTLDFWLAPDAGVVKWHRRFSKTRFEKTELTTKTPRH